MTHYMDAQVASGDVTEDRCPNGCGQSVSIEWVAIGAEGTVVLGYTLACMVCRPHGVWACRFCPDLVPLDAERIRAHLNRCIATHG